jgi:hypothetical protein
MSRPIRLAVVGALALVASGVGAAAPAHASDPVVPCHWIDREYSSTYTCEEPVETVQPLQIVECWRFPAPTRTFMRHKTDAGWVRNPDITVKVRGGKGCAEPFPHRTVVTIPAALLAEMQPTRVRMTMPQHDVTLPDGSIRTVGKTVVTYGACLMPADAGDWCPER